MGSTRRHNQRRQAGAWGAVRGRMVQLLAHSESFAALGQKLNTATTPVAAARVIVKAADKLLGWDACTVSMYSSETDSTSPVLKIDTVAGRRVEVTSEIVTTRPTARERKVLTEGGQLVLRQRPAFEPGWIPFGDTSRPSASIIAVPIRHGSKVTGLLSIQSYTRNAYNRESLATLQALADYCGGALDRIRAETELRESKDRFATFMGHLPGFAWIKDTRGRYLYVNKARAGLGKNTHDWRGKTDAELWPPDLAAEYQANDRKVVADRRAIQAVEPYLRNGERRFVVVSKFPILDQAGAVVMVGGVSVDITDRRRAEEELQRSREQLRALAIRLQKTREDESLRIAREIHDVFGQALATLNLDVVWLGEKIAREKDRALRSQLGRRMKSMQVLLHSTVNSVQRFCQDLRPAMLDDLGLAATLQWQAEAFEKRTRIRCQWKPKPEAVILNGNAATALFRIFQETLHNVARHARARRVTLKLQKISGHLVLKVADDGAGFDESKLPVRKSLGLLGMRERAILIGADLQVQSAPGKGTTVTVTMPITGAILNKIRKHGLRGHAA